ncbi:MAG: DUF4489 domain-containing protein [Ruminiclostridium sp.]|nr:DUF4489 domain-containing protein [Ruminiclostridium sp.]
MADNDRFDKKEGCFPCPDPGHPLPKPILFECGNGGGFTFAANGSSSDERNAPCICVPKTVANVTLDTSCLCMPKVKIEFSSIIHFIPKCVGSAQLEFDLVKCCRDFPECTVGTWNYEISGEEDKFAKSFCFDYCECSSCPNCCTYIVKCRPVYVNNAAICVANCQIAAFAQTH